MHVVQELPPLPPIGRSEAYYSMLVHEADKHGDKIAHEAAKVGQYITLALNPTVRWPEKLKYFKHAIRRHCNPPVGAAQQVVTFYTQLKEMVRRHAADQAMRLISREDDVYMSRMRNGHRPFEIARDAHEFFGHFVPDNSQPEWFDADDYRHICIMRDHWINPQEMAKAAGGPSHEPAEEMVTE